MTNPSRRATLSILSVVAAATLWGTIGTAFQLLRDRYDSEPVATVTIRAVTAALAVWLWILIINPRAARISWKDVPGVALFSFITVTAFYLALIYNYKHSGVRAGTMLLYLAPAFVTFAGAAFLGERISRRQWVALALTVAGCAGAVGLVDQGLSGVGAAGLGFGVASAICYGAYSVLGKHWLDRYPALTVIGYDFLFGALGLIVIKVIVSPGDWPNAEGITVIGLTIGIFITLAPLSFYTIGLQGLPASKAATIATLEPVVALLLATFVLHEPITALQLSGAALVIGGLLLLTTGVAGVPVEPPVLEPEAQSLT